MANKKIMLGALVLVLACGFALMGCATASSIGGTADTHGLISKAPVVAEGGEVIAEYKVIIGLIDSGYEEYAAAVMAAQAEGKKITTVTKWLVFLTKTTAYANAKAPGSAASPAPAPAPQAEEEPAL
ncbi:MAG: hypothetical protein LBD37_07705 [Treponema sp.]|jgi:hypothetical protein|nr:hypothetical protein [Treponema sp.]